MTAKRPVGVSLPGRPTATENERTAWPSRRSVSRRAERSTGIEKFVLASRARSSRIQPARPLGRSLASTRSQPPRRAVTLSTRGESNSVRVPSQCSGRPPGVARSCVTFSTRAVR